MDERNNFDDIILDKSNKSERVKKLLLRIIALAILFLVVLIVMKLIKSDDKSSTQPIFPPDPSIADTNIPVSTEPADDEFTLMMQRLQGNIDDNASEDNQSTLAEPVGEINISQIINSAPQIDEPAEKPASKPAQPAAKPATEKPKSADKPKTTQTQKPATSTQKLAAKPATPAQSESGLQSGSYVQVFSVKNFDTKSRELALVTKNGYKYSTRKKGEVTQILIGPFSKDELAAELPKIRETISKDAFAVSVK